MIKGYRTLVAAILLAIAWGLQMKYGFVIPAEIQEAVVIILMATLRVVTKTPIFENPVE